MPPGKKRVNELKTVFIGLGSNLQDPVSQLNQAIDHIRQVPQIVLKQVSRFYQSRPMGPQDQPDFINAVAKIQTTLEPMALLMGLQRIEALHQRQRTAAHWGPRTIDLDILLVDNKIIKMKDLQIPHPHLCQREFVVYPLYEIAPDWQLPSGESMTDIKRRCSPNGITLLPVNQHEMMA